MEELINSLSKLSVDKDDDIDLLCQSLCKVKIEDIKEVQDKLPEEAKKILFNFFSILAKKGRCTVNTDMILNKLIY
jgi:hypothetical protein